MPEGPHDVTAYAGDRLIGPVRPLEWNRAFDAMNPFALPPVDPTVDPFADPTPTVPTRSRYLDALTAKGTKRRHAQDGIRFRQLEEGRDV